jgi:hypothetical protein
MFYGFGVVAKCLNISVDIKIDITGDIPCLIILPHPLRRSGIG